MDGITLLDIAFENTDENIIRLITRVTPFLVSIAIYISIFYSKSFPLTAVQQKEKMN